MSNRPQTSKRLASIRSRGALHIWGRARRVEDPFWGIVNYIVNGPLTVVHAAAGAKLAVEGMIAYLRL
ncbi:hypothetical protein DWX16_03090 [Collinsella sp. AF18-33LB]|nr:hypothetical protein DWX16_03090 [Collinsella sp. AF18-33LB]